jgi:hypothetical protein
MPLAPGDGRDPSGLRQPVLRLAVRRGADMHHLDMPFRSGAAKVSGMPSGESLGKAGLKGMEDTLLCAAAACCCHVLGEPLAPRSWPIS